MSKPVEEQQTIFRVSNHHIPECGRPPFFDGDEEETYVGYFADEDGEQAIFHYDYQTSKATLRMGDTGWENVYTVENGRADALILSRPAMLWLMACWEVATGKEIEA